MNMLNGGYSEAALIGLTGNGLNLPRQPYSDGSGRMRILHQAAGNLGMADGSVQQTSLNGLKNALLDTVSARGSGTKPFTTVNTILNMP